MVQAVALPPISPALMRAPGVPQCGLPARPDYQPAEVMAYAKCWEAAYHRAAGGLIGLQKAVAVREKATETALNVAKKT